MNQNFEVQYTDVYGDQWIQLFTTKEEADEFIDNLLEEGLIMQRDEAKITAIKE